MIRLIHIRHFTLVDELSVELEPGMTVLTGETGAGKSILLDALGLALGGRADNNWIRQGHDKAQIHVEFELPASHAAIDWLKEQELADEEQESLCVIRRTIHRTSASKAFINDRPVTVQSLKTLGDLLVDIHGQHAHQSLMKKDLQREAVDDFAAHQSLLDSVNREYDTLKQLLAQQRAMQQSQEERKQRLDLLQYQLLELDNLDLQAGESEQLDAEQRKLSSVTQIQHAGEKSLYALKEGEEDNLLNRLGHMIYELEQIAELDPALRSVVEQMEGARIQLADCGDELRHYLDSLSVDGERLQWIDQRLNAILDISRKHRIEADEIIALHERLRQEFDTLNNAEQVADSLQDNIKQANKRYLEFATKLSASRQKAAKQLAKQVSDNLSYLGMQHGKFDIAFENLDTPHRGGMERLEFQVSTNPGHPAGPLSKIASGGELSRISLAIQVVTAKTGRIPSLIFDEVDVGIGGGTAEVVGRLLRDLAKQRQVLCVTHQPQVASLAHQHLHVSKSSDKKQTSTKVVKLNQAERTEEIARMLGGVDLTEQTRSHAKEMLNKSAEDSVPVA